MPAVLVVDDSRMDQRLVGAMLRDTSKLDVEYASDGLEALERIRANPPDLIITDYLMPQMDGLELLLKVGREYPLIPVILVTGYGSEEVAFKAACSGARAYVPKASLAKLLPGMVQQLLTVCKEKRELNRFLQSITESECTFLIRDNDTSIIAHVLEYSTACMRTAQICDEGGEELVCLALEEALRNAVHHGNLELNSKLREEYDDEKYTELFEQRRRTAPYCDRKVTVKVQISREGAKFVIRDEGPGFDPHAVPDPTAPENIEAVCGRGIWLMRSLMTEVSYNARGNEVTLIKRPTPKSAENE
jgi:CheY-like chemotaxis protein